MRIFTFFVDHLDDLSEMIFFGGGPDDAGAAVATTGAAAAAVDGSAPAEDSFSSVKDVGGRMRAKADLDRTLVSSAADDEAVAATDADDSLTVSGGVMRGRTSRFLEVIESSFFLSASLSSAELGAGVDVAFRTSSSSSSDDINNFSSNSSSVKGGFDVEALRSKGTLEG